MCVIKWGRFEKYVTDLMEKEKIPGVAIAISQNGQVIYERGFGVIDIETKEPVTPEVLKAYGVDSLEFGPGYIIPKAVDSRLLGVVSSAVAQAAIDTGVARKPYPANYPLTSLDDL